MLSNPKKAVAIILMATCIVGAQATQAYAHVKNSTVVRLIDKRVQHTHLYEEISGNALIPYWGAANKCHHSGCYLLDEARLKHWTVRDIRARAQMTPWPAYWLPEATCVHSNEGAWNDATGNGYYGGMQMDVSFEQAYGPTFYARWGNANNWPATSQLIASYRAYLSRGWEPWPNTSLMCGL